MRESPFAASFRSWSRRAFSRLAVPFCAVAVLAAVGPSVRADEVTVPVLVPITGFLSLEGTSQRNGALLALREAPAAAGGVGVAAPVSDTATSPEVAVNALEKAMRDRGVVAIAASMLGTQMLAMIPVADGYGVPLVTVSGTARITELGSPNVFRFFPGDSVVKVAHARYAVEVRGAKRPAILFQTTAYGQSGRAHLAETLATLGAPAVFEEGLSTDVKDMLPVLAKVRDSGADMLLLHLHSGPTALLVRQAKAMGLGLPIVAGSAMHQPQTAALIEPDALDGVCAESGSSPISGETPAIRDFVERYREAFATEPDAFALGQYDGMRMVLDAVSKGARTAEAVRTALAGGTHEGLAMTYKSDGRGNMAHDAVIICYEGGSRVPRVVERYENIDGSR